MKNRRVVNRPLLLEELEGRLTTPYEKVLTTLVDNIQHTESITVNGQVVVKVYLQRGASVDTANAQVSSASQFILRNLPPGTLPPQIINFSASSVPIIQLGLSGKGMSEQQLNDLGVNFIRPQLATIQGASVPIPYGGKVRQVMVDIDSHQLMAKGLSPMDVVNAVNVQNVILPSGTAKIGRTEYNVGLNGTPSAVDALNHIPVKVIAGGTIYIEDVAHVRDGFQPQTNIVRLDGTRASLLTINKSGNASTLDIVARVKALLPRQVTYCEPLSVRISSGAP